MKLPGSNFVSVIGLCVLAVLILVCAYLGYSLLQSFLVVIALLCLVSYVWARFSLRNISVKFQDSESRAFPGQKLEVDAKLHNAKFLPLLWLDLVFPTEGKSCVAADVEEGMEETFHPEDPDASEAVIPISESFSWIMPQQKLSWHQTAQAVHRGVCKVPALELQSGDGFGLTVQKRSVSIPGGFRFVVYPKIVPVDITLILNNMSELEPVKNGFYTDKTLLSGTRDYRDGDSFRDINWRLLARTDSIQVNVHEKLSMRRVCFIPDMESFVTVTEEHNTSDGKRIVREVQKDEMERMFSLMASMIVALNDREVLCTLVVPGIGEKEARLVVPEVREDQVAEHLTALAEIDYQAEETRLPVDEMLSEMHKLGQIYILSSNHQKAIGKAHDEEMGLIRILQEADEETLSARTIFSETEFLTV